jgi:hypothetical protein
MFEIVGQWIIFAGAVAAALTVLWKWPIGPIYRKGKTALVEEIREVVADELESIKEELSANGGTSVKDIALATRDRVDELSRQIEQTITGQ